MPRGGKREGAGRPKGSRSAATKEQIANISDLAKMHAEMAVTALAQIAQGGESEAARVSAANALLDRGYGKPMQAVDHSSSDGTMTPQGVSDDLRAALDAIAGKLSTSDGEGEVAGDGETGADSTSG